MPFRADVRDNFISCGILTLPSIYILSAILLAKENFSSKNSDFHSYPTRHKDHFRIPYIRLNSSRNAGNYFGPKFFNHLPEHVKSLPVLKLKAAVKKALLAKAFYSTKEFLESNLNDLF